jgi:hypothetical protein
MERGQIGGESILLGVQWFEKKTTGVITELIHTPNEEGMIYIDAARCRFCRIVSFNY